MGRRGQERERKRFSNDFYKGRSPYSLSKKKKKKKKERRKKRLAEAALV